MGKRRRIAGDDEDDLVGLSFTSEQLFEDVGGMAEDDSSRTKGGTGSQCLPIDSDEEQAADGEFASGASYLAWVRQEAAARPSFISVALPYPTPPPSAAAIPVSRPPVGAPPVQWREDFIARFKALRQTMREAEDPVLPEESHILYTMPQDLDENAWRAWIHGRKSSIDDPTAEPRHRPKQPTALLLRQMSHNMRITLLEYFTEWLRPAIETAVAGPSTAMLPPRVRKAASASQRAASVSSAASASTAPVQLISSLDGQWLFAILASLDELLSTADIGTLRSLARLCRTCGQHLAGGRSVTDAAQVEQRAVCWSVVAAVTTWGQSDLWEA